MTRKHRIDYEQLREIIEEQPRIYWHPGDPPPPWQPPTRGNLNHYRWAMIDFVEWHLYNRLPELDLTSANPPDVYKRQIEWLTEWQNNHGTEIAAAERGDILPLRKKLPHLAKFLHVPERKRKRGEHITHGQSLSERAHRAADMVPEVRAIWQKHYGKKVRRLRPTTEEIVADIFGVEVRHVKLKLSRDKQQKYDQKKLKAKKPKKNK